MSGCRKMLLYTPFSVLLPVYRIVSTGVNVSGCKKILLSFIHSILCPVYRIVSTGVNVFGCRKMHVYISFPVWHT